MKTDQPTTRACQSAAGITLLAETAGPVIRAYAWLIDLLIRGLLYVGIFTVMELLGRTGAGLAALMLFILEWFYPVLFEVLRQGATPGKAWLGLQVVHDDLTPVGWSASLLRNFFRGIDFLPLLYFTGLLSMLFSRDFRRIGDHMASTVVIYTPRPQLSLYTAPAAHEVISSASLSPLQRQAIIDLYQRRDSLEPDAFTALAAQLIPATVAATPTQRDALAAQIYGRETSSS